MVVLSTPRKKPSRSQEHSPQIDPKSSSPRIGIAAIVPPNTNTHPIALKRSSPMPVICRADLTWRFENRLLPKLCHVQMSLSTGWTVACLPISSTLRSPPLSPPSNMKSSPSATTVVSLVYRLGLPDAPLSPASSPTSSALITTFPLTGCCCGFLCTEACSALLFRSRSMSRKQQTPKLSPVTSSLSGLLETFQKLSPTPEPRRAASPN